MSQFIHHNGEVKKANEVCIQPGDRSFRFGDGLFETMLIENGLIRNSKLHFERLFEGMELLKFKVPVSFNQRAIEELMAELFKKNSCEGLAQGRLIVSRGGGALFQPDDKFQYIMECDDLKERSISGLTIGVFEVAAKAMNKFSNLKSSNYLVSVMAAIHAKENKLDDCIILNSEGRVCETTIANIFCVINGKVHTPPLSEGCVNGVMRKVVMGKYGVIEKALSIGDVEKSEEVFLTNAVRGIMSVKQFGSKNYKHAVADEIRKLVS